MSRPSAVSVYTPRRRTRPAVQLHSAKCQGPRNSVSLRRVPVTSEILNSFEDNIQLKLGYVFVLQHAVCWPDHHVGNVYRVLSRIVSAPREGNDVTPGGVDSSALPGKTQDSVSRVRALGPRSIRPPSKGAGVPCHGGGGLFQLPLHPGHYTPRVPSYLHHSQSNL